MSTLARGPRAARIRERKLALLRQLSVPRDALPGSFSLTRRKCGKPTCHCASGVGHPLWLLTFMADGKKHVERIPADWVDEIRSRVDEGRAFKDAVHEVLVANARLLVLARKQRDR